MNNLTTYEDFLRRKAVMAPDAGFAVTLDEINPILKPHQKLMVHWGVAGGRRAIFAKFGLGKSVIQLEICRLILLKSGGTRALITAPLGVRQEFKRDAAMLGLEIKFIRSMAEASEPGIYLTNFETVRDGKLNPAEFDVCSLDEASVLRGFGGTKIFREFMRLYDGVAYKFVATAIPDPNDTIELLAYAESEREVRRNLLAKWNQYEETVQKMKTIVTDVVRENNQTYRLGWSDMCKDATTKGVGMPEYLLLFRKPPTDTSNSYGDVPVVKHKPLCVTIEQFTMKGEWVYDPFGGLMTTPFRAIKLGRKGLAAELNPGYFLDGCAYLKMAEREMSTPTLFDLNPEELEVAS